MSERKAPRRYTADDVAYIRDQIENQGKTQAEVAELLQTNQPTISNLCVTHKIGQLNPLKRPGQPHELAAMGLFLASDEASYVNGQAFPVDGGLTASMPYTGKPV